MIRWAVLFAILAGCVGDETLTKYGAAGKVWVLEEVNGTPFAHRATIEFKGQDEVVGRAPCNRFFARQTEPYPWFKLEGIGATKMACDALAAEGAYFDALRAMRLAEVAGETLILSNTEGGEMVFRATGG